MSQADEPAPIPPRKVPGGVVAAGILLLVAAVMIATAIGSGDEPTLPATPASYAPTLHTVVYSIDGTAESASITLRASTGTQQATGRAVPQSLTREMSSGDFVYISAQNEGSYGTISCAITVDGQEISRNGAVGGYTIASCEGRVP